MSTPKKPQDHRPKAEDRDPATATFSFAHDGKTYTSGPIAEVITPGFIRKHRRLQDMDFSFTVLEVLFDDEPAALDALDSMPWSEVKQVSEALEQQMRESVQLALGESGRSST